MKILHSTKKLIISKQFQNILIFTIPAIILFPFLLGNILHSKLYFTGYLMNAHDQNIYFGFMKQAKDGYLCFLNLPSNIIHPRQYIHTLFLLQGFLSRITNIPLVYVHLLSSYSFAVLFGLTIRVIALKIFQNNIFTSITIAVTMFGSGFGIFGKIYSSIANHEMTVKNMSSFPGDLWMPEMTVWNSICYTPLFIWSYLLIILVYAGIWVGEVKKTFLPFIISATAVFLIALSHSYDLVPLGVISLLLLILFRIYKRQWLIELPIFLGYCVYAILFLGAMGYQYYVLTTNAGFTVWASKNVNLAPNFIVILMGFGVLSLGYIECFIRLFNDIKNKNYHIRISKQDLTNTIPFDKNPLLVDLLTRFICFWLIIQTLMLYSPFPFARRFILAICIPLVICFILFIKRITLKKNHINILLAIALVALTFLTPLYQLLANTVKVVKADKRFYYSPEQLTAYSFMNKGLNSNDVVFATFHESNNLLRFSPAAMLVGSTQQSSEEIQKDVNSLFAGSDLPLVTFLQKNRVSYIFLDKKNDKLFIKKHSAFLKTLSPIFKNNNYIIYAIKKE